jgi:hypothetical protein
MENVLPDCKGPPNFNITNDMLNEVVKVGTIAGPKVMGVSIPFPSLTFDINPLKTEVDAYVDKIGTYAKCNVTNFDATPIIQKGLDTVQGMDLQPLVEKAMDIGGALLKNPVSTTVMERLLKRVQKHLTQVREVCSEISQWGAIVGTVIVGLLAFIALCVLSGRKFWVWGLPLILATVVSWFLFARALIEQRWTDLYCKVMNTVDTDTCESREDIAWKGGLMVIVALLVIYELVIHLYLFKKDRS